MVVTISVICSIIALCAGAVVRRAIANARSRKSWRMTKGTIASLEVLQIDTHFTGVVRYRYALEAASPYRGPGRGEAVPMEGRLESPLSPTRDEAEQLLARYLVGDRVDVRYDPSRPTRSMLADLESKPRQLR